MGDYDKFTETETKQTKNYELVSIKDGNSIEANVSGGMFHTYVSVDTHGEYTFYYKLSDNSFKMGKINADNTVVFEDDNCSPHIVEYTTKSYPNSCNFLHIFFQSI